MMQGHTRFATSSIADLKGCHPHSWTKPKQLKYWPSTEGGHFNEAPIITNVECWVTHNGDFEFFEAAGALLELGDIQALLSSLHNVPKPASGSDSLCVIGRRK